MFVAAEKEMIPRWPLQLASKMRPGMPSTEQNNDTFSELVVEREVSEEKWESTRSAKKTENCVENVRRDMWKRQR